MIGDRFRKMVGRNSYAEFLNQGSGLLSFGQSGLNRIRHDGGGLLAGRNEFNRRGQVLDVLPGRAARDQHEIGYGDCGGNDGFDERRGIQQNEFCGATFGLRYRCGKRE